MQESKEQQERKEQSSTEQDLIFDFDTSCSESKLGDLMEKKPTFQSNEEQVRKMKQEMLEQIEANYGKDRPLHVSPTTQQPLIGILSQPTSEAMKKVNPYYDEYMLGINYQFITMSGARPVFISYMSDDEEDQKRLYQVLNSINGVLFTGGNLTLIDQTSGETHPYYRTAKKIIEYSIKMKDTQNLDFPILGICQGFELFGLVASNDQKDLLKQIKILNQQLPIGWINEPRKVREESKTFSGFSQETIETMAVEQVAQHFHNWGIIESDFDSNDLLKAFYKKISVNQSSEGVRYVTGMEAYNYPLYSVIYHPEYMMIMKPNPLTLEIAQSFSNLIGSEGIKNHNQRESQNLNNIEDQHKAEAIDTICQLEMFAYMPGVYSMYWGVNKAEHQKKRQEFYQK